jgi:hypothetical protein
MRELPRYFGLIWDLRRKRVRNPVNPHDSLPFNSDAGGILVDMAFKSRVVPTDFKQDLFAAVIYKGE